MQYFIRPIGVVRSPLKNLKDCPHQGREGAPQAWIELDPTYADGLLGLKPGSEVIILTWLHLADRSLLRVHPRGDARNPVTGVFNTRSPHRPNPIGLHRATVLAVEPPASVLVEPLEALDDTPVIDIKSALGDES
ncbi:MAG: tRNA (N6-threonylcarbamoyladenosine(37)-N6)-methyltransferase TrmO [Desulfomonilaceae bacterium]